VDSLQLRRREALVRLPRSGLWPEGCYSYGPGRYFLCRHCYDLRYESQREDKMDRALRRAQKIRKRLGGSANMMEPFPEKPKGIHVKTYMRMFWKHHEVEMEQLASIREWLD
jgi:hypothetical protein